MTQTFTYDIRELQLMLAKVGYNPGDIDGELGPKTERAIVAFKRSIGYRPRPFVGPKTWAALVEASRNVKPVPQLPWMQEAASVMGLHEIRDKAALSAWLRSDGKTLGDPTALPWCGDFAETITKNALPDEPFPGALGENPYWARNWALLGVSCGRVYGAYAVFARGSGGHIGNLIGVSDDGQKLRIRGGNQSNMVRDSWLDAGRLLALRWPSTWPIGHQRPAPVLSSRGAVISTNEA